MRSLVLLFLCVSFVAGADDTNVTRDVGTWNIRYMTSEPRGGKNTAKRYHILAKLNAPQTDDDAKICIVLESMDTDIAKAIARMERRLKDYGTEAEAEEMGKLAKQFFGN